MLKKDINRERGIHMIEVKTKERVGEAMLSFSKIYAEKKADSFCRGRMYEPKVPRKLVRISR